MGISMQNEELAAQRQEIESLRNDKQNIEQHYQAPAGAQEDDGCGCAAHAGRGETPLRPPESGELAPAAADHHAQGREDESTAADPWPSAPDPGDRGASAAIRFAELLPLYSEFLCVEGAACNGPETPALLFFHYPSVFSNGPTKRPRVLERLSCCAVARGCS